MTNIIEHGSDGNLNEEVAQIGSSPNSISIKDYQDIYHQITGRTESISQRSTKNVLIEFSEIQQLHYKILQICDVHKVIARNEHITIFHEKERKEQFTSFKRFEKYNNNATSPTLSVLLKYNFSILLAGLDKPQEYVVTIRLTSRTAALKALEEEAPPFMRSRVFSFGSMMHTAELSIDYVDYIVARAFLAAYDEWINGCSSNSGNKAVLFLQQYTHFLPIISQIILVALFFYYCTAAVSKFLGQADPVIWGRFIVIFGAGLYFSHYFARVAGRFLELAVDGYQPLSYVKLNKGDEELVKQHLSRKKATIGKFFVSAVFTICLGIVSSKLANLI